MRMMPAQLKQTVLYFSARETNLTLCLTKLCKFINSIQIYLDNASGLQKV